MDTVTVTVVVGVAASPAPEAALQWRTARRRVAVVPAWRPAGVADTRAHAEDLQALAQVADTPAHAGDLPARAQAAHR
jgi:hypothetical protein